MTLLKTEIITDNRGNNYTVNFYKIISGNVIYTVRDSFEKVVDTGKFKTKALVMKHLTDWLKG